MLNLFYFDFVAAAGGFGLRAKIRNSAESDRSPGPRRIAASTGQGTAGQSTFTAPFF
jgi:hypothetical protein